MASTTDSIFPRVSYLYVSTCCQLIPTNGRRGVGWKYLVSKLSRTLVAISFSAGRSFMILPSILNPTFSSQNDSSIQMVACVTIRYCCQHSDLESASAQGDISQMRRCLFMSHLCSRFSVSRMCRESSVSSNIRERSSGGCLFAPVCSEQRANLFLAVRNHLHVPLSPGIKRQKNSLSQMLWLGRNKFFVLT
jgi:hypothetical protein